MPLPAEVMDNARKCIILNYSPSADLELPPASSSLLHPLRDPR